MRFYGKLTAQERSEMSVKELEDHLNSMQLYITDLPDIVEDEKVFYLCEQVFDRAMILKHQGRPIGS